MGSKAIKLFAKWELILCMILTIVRAYRTMRSDAKNI
jgi:hypothetical protein